MSAPRSWLGINPAMCQRLRHTSATCSVAKRLALPVRRTLEREQCGFEMARIDHRLNGSPALRCRHRQIGRDSISDGGLIHACAESNSGRYLCGGSGPRLGNCAIVCRLESNVGRQYARLEP